MGADGDESRAKPVTGDEPTAAAGEVSADGATVAAPSAPNGVVSGTGPTASEPAAARRDRGRAVPTRHEAGDRIGRYQVIEPIGAGGIGVVLKARDPELARDVAIKLLQLDRAPATEEARARLVREGQAIAQLAHPNVVSVFDVGTVGDEAFVAMEYVDGQSLTAWLKADDRRLDEIFDAFLQAGRGLAAAHEKGIIHRDFKPDNVLVGADGRVRVVDFGLARALEAAPEARGERSGSQDSGQLAETLTRTGSIMGTPAYMAPEQHLGEATDARTDQFAFCVALYEAVTQQRPFAGDNYRQLCANVLAGKMREPPAGVRVPSWLRALWARGLSRDPDARFASMQPILDALGRDRNASRRRALVAGGFVALAAAGALAIVLVGQGKDTRCTGARAKLSGVWDAPVKERVQRAFSAMPGQLGMEAWNRVQTRLDSYAAAWAAMHTETCRATRVRGEQSEKVLDVRMNCLERRRLELASAAGLFADADRDLVERSARVLAQLTPVSACADVEALTAPVPLPTDRDQRRQVEDLQAELARADALRWAGRFADGLAIAERVVPAAKQLGHQPLEAEALMTVGLVQLNLDHADQAERSLSDAVYAAIASKHVDVQLRASIELVSAIGTGLHRHDDALGWAKQARAALAAVGGDPVREANLENYLGSVYEDAANYDEALAHHEKALAIRRTLGPDHARSVAVSLNNLGIVYQSQGQYAEAVARFEEAHALLRDDMGAHHPYVGQTAQNLGNIYFALGELDKAERYYQQTHDIVLDLYGPDSAQVADALFNLAILTDSRGEHAAAQKMLEDVLAVQQREHGQNDPRVAKTLNSLGVVAQESGADQAALEYFQQARRIHVQVLGDSSPEAAFATLNVASALAELDRRDDAIAEYETAIATYRALHGDSHDLIAYALAAIGELRLQQGRADDAIEAIEQALRIYDQVETDPVRKAAAQFAMAQALIAAHRGGKRAVEFARAALAIYEDAGDRAVEERKKVQVWLKQHGARQ